MWCCQQCGYFRAMSNEINSNIRLIKLWYTSTSLFVDNVTCDNQKKKRLLYGVWSHQYRQWGSHSSGCQGTFTAQKWLVEYLYMQAFFLFPVIHEIHTRNFHPWALQRIMASFIQFLVLKGFGLVCHILTRGGSLLVK